jgi:hypothetical protein
VAKLVAVAFHPVGAVRAFAEGFVVGKEAGVRVDGFEGHMLDVLRWVAIE